MYISVYSNYIYIYDISVYSIYLSFFAKSLNEPFNDDIQGRRQFKLGIVIFEEIQAVITILYFVGIFFKNCFKGKTGYLR